MDLIIHPHTSMVRLISLQVYDLEQLPLPKSNITDNMPTGIACPICNTEIYANADIPMMVSKQKRIPAWCTSYFCPWRGLLRVYNEKDTA
jgi:hypothetical protein